MKTRLAWISEEFGSAKAPIFHLPEDKVPRHSAGANGVLVDFYFAEFSHSLRTDMTHDELVKHTKELFRKQDGKCSLTGIPMKAEHGGPLAISPDRIDSNVGYVRGNIQLTVWAANRAKGDTPDAEFREFIDQVRAIG